MSLRNRGKRRVLEWQHDKQLDKNNEPQPFPYGHAFKTIIVEPEYAFENIHYKSGLVDKIFNTYKCIRYYDLAIKNGSYFYEKSLFPGIHHEQRNKTENFEPP